jgi:hypothetical protein
MNAHRRALPPIGDELTQPHRRVDLRALKQANLIDDTAVEANSRALSARWGASTRVKPDGIPSGDAAAEPPRASLRLEIPDYLDHALTLAAAERRVTKAFLVTTALSQAGYHVEPKDLVPDRRKARSRKV